MENPTFGLNDLTNLLAVVDACVTRGAFQPAEIEAVGALRNRLAAFVQSSTPVTEEPVEETAE